MARTGMEAGSTGVSSEQNTLNFQADGAERIELPSSEFIADAKMTRDGADLILETPDGQVAVIEGYFNADPAPLLQSPNGATLTPNLVDAFAKSPMEFAAKDSASDESPVGAVEEVKGEATVTRADGTVEKITIGTPIYQGDVVETDASGAVNIVFIDETSMAISENARLAINEYTFDPSTESGTTNFSVLRGLFVFTSGLIGRDDPDDVSIDTPVGSIGIRGTVIAGEINPDGESKITVLEGAIVVTNGAMETVLSEQFQTVSLNGYDQPMNDMGVVPANDIGARFNSIGDVNPSLFTTINDAANEQTPTTQQNQQQPPSEQPVSEPQSQTESAPPASMDSGMMTLDGNSTGLPSQNTVAGQPSATGSPTSSGPVADSTPPPPPPSSTGGTTTAAPPPPSTADQLPPPPPSTGGTTGTPPPPMSFSGGVFSDITESNTVVGRISSGLTGLTISSPYFSLVTDATGANVVLNTAGETALDGSLDVTQLGSFTVTGQNANGDTITRTFSTTVVDANTVSNSVNLNGVASAQKFAIIADNLSNNVGYTITSLGDVNNDGFDDFAFSNNTPNSAQNHIHRIYGTDGQMASGNLAGYPGMNTLPNPTPASGTDGTVMAGIGDFNGDHVEDYVIGQSNNGLFGNIAIVGGSTATSPGNITFTGTGTAGAQVGYSVDGAGDFNNDGFADVIVGAPTSGSGGVAYLIKGRSDWNTDINVDNPTPNGAQVINGATASSYGSSVSGIGDYNGDGFSDFAVGAPSAGGGAGSVRIYFGNQSSSTAGFATITGDPGEALGTEVIGLGDINGDGRSDLLMAGDGNIGRIYFGQNGGGTSSSVSLDISNSYTVTGGGAVGDFNGDGFDDFTIALADANGTHAYVVYGKDSWSGTINLEYLKDPAHAMEIKYSGATDASDIEMNGIGDINGDGFDDFAIGVPDANGAATGNGGVAIVYGRDTGKVSLPLGTGAATADGQVLVGSRNNDVLSDGDNDNVNMRGGAGRDIFMVHNTNFLGIDGGGNIQGTDPDTIRAMADLDFTDVNFEQVSGIEKIEFWNNNQTITLTMENLFNLMKSSDDGILRIDGAGTGMQLILSNGTGGDDFAGISNSPTQIELLIDAATDADVTYSTTVENGNNYDVFAIGGYKLMIEQGSIAVDAQ